MTTTTSSQYLDRRTRNGMIIVTVYPVVVCLASIAINVFAFKPSSMQITLPSIACIQALVISGVLLTINHTWLMTATELTRARFKLFATPEEWAASGIKAEDASTDGIRELQRHHNAHRNTTENTVYFVLLAAVFAFTSPTSVAAYVWIVGFAVARMGHVYGYLRGKDGIRGIFMTLSLLALYGLASHLVLRL